MADSISQIQIGNSTSLVDALVSIDNTTGTVGANVSLLSGGVQVPVTVTTATLGANGAVTIAGTSLVGTTVGISFTNGAPTAAVTTTVAGIATTNTEAAVAVCFCSGTLIRTPDGDVPVERLAAGDLVVTASGEHRPIMWIGHRRLRGRALAGNLQALPICIEAGALAENAPSRDLWVSPDHSLCIDGYLVAAYDLVNDVSIRQVEVDTVTFFNFDFGTHDLVIAEGILAESFLDVGCRQHFENASEFEALYPDHEVSRTPCAPRLGCGFELEAIRGRINKRAGIVAPAVQSLGPIFGAVDVAGPDHVSGWVVDCDNRTAPVTIDILVDGVFVACTLANRFRRDLCVPEIGSGFHAFDVELPRDVQGRVEVRRSNDHLVLPHGTCAVVSLAA